MGRRTGGENLAEQPPAADCLQRPLRFRFRQRLRRGVRLPWPRVGRKESTMQVSAFHPWGSVLCFALCAMLILALDPLVAPLAAEAQLPGKVYRIGYLGTTPRDFQPPQPSSDWWEALLDGLRERGYHEGRNFVFERRFSEGHAERF